MEPSWLPILSLFLLFLLHGCLNGVALGPVRSNVQRSDGLCNTFVLSLKVYNCEELVVQSEDGFLLGVQRISRRGYFGDLNGPVFLLHGILLGGDVWVLNPPEESFAFVLADAGFDVWIGNTRTTRFSYGHVSYTKADRGFWDWSVDELAAYDLPAMLGLIQLQTKRKIHFIGYSQGSQQAFVAFSQGQLIDMVEKVVMLAPVTYVNNLFSPLSVLAATLYFDKLYEALHVYEFGTQLQGKEVVDIICKPAGEKCYKTFITLFTGNNCCINYTRRPLYDEYETQPTATKNLAHIAQQYRQKTFAKFDYGFWGNLIRYHWPFPPAYDLSKVPTSNLFMVYGGQDALADTKDVKLLLSLLSGQVSVGFIPQYAHIDFILAMNAKHLVYDQAMEFLRS